MTQRTQRPTSISTKLLKSIGLAYFPELTHDKTGQTKVVIPTYVSHLAAEKKLSHAALSQDATVAVPDSLEEVVADLAVKQRPTFVTAASETTLATSLPEISSPTTAVLDLNVPNPIAPVDTPVNHRPQRSDSGSTLAEPVKVSLAEYINNNCPHIAHNTFTRPLLLPSLSLEEIAGFSGWFTNKIKTQLKWER
jgi:hypothetical protein